jgi:dipeptidyl aminopeptidase/acylaminoacyl peptidase
LVSTRFDGSEVKNLMENRLRDVRIAQYQDSVVDWLPDDREHVLVQVPGDGGDGVSRLNIFTGALTQEEPVRQNARVWLSDGHGTPRVYWSLTERERRWMVRDSADSGWSVLHQAKAEDLNDSFVPIGFAESRSELLVFEDYEGRTALFAYDLANNRQRRLVYSHPIFDLNGVHTLGKYQRLVAATYADDRPRMHFFDARLESAHAALSPLFPGTSVSIVDESWDQRYYLVLVTSATDPGAYYRYDTTDNVVAKIGATYPSLASRELAPMSSVRYAADDGVEIPAYLTVPPGTSGRVPAIILPHGGPASRDYWDYDFLAQYLAAKGYAVLQSNYRGSDGYGAAWQGEGGFRNWRRAISDIEAGTQYLVDEGIADPARICTVGWSYGGYAALMTAIERPERYRCIVSIAGVTDLATLGTMLGRAATYLGEDAQDRKEGSPIERADEIQAPVLLLHGRQDVNAPFRQSAAMARALEKAKKDVELIEYDGAEHNIQPERFRIDLLTRIGEFLDAHL